MRTTRSRLAIAPNCANEVPTNTHNVQAEAHLGDKVLSADELPANCVPSLSQSSDDLFEVGPTVYGEQANHILKKRSRRLTLTKNAHQFIHNLTIFTIQTLSALKSQLCERLTTESGHEDIEGWYIPRVNTPDVNDWLCWSVLRAEVLNVGCASMRVLFTCEHASSTQRFQAEAKSTNPCKHIDKSKPRLRCRAASNSPRLI
mmetsp:Transcript_68730/g.184021  ORF Transcript_68730/g.184021 Transcript_68730/m.184021 type:complete len:202 (+) Transcript_68730:662-1267(+)